MIIKINGQPYELATKEEVMKEVTNRYYPVGHIIISLNPNYNPNNQIQDTKWQLIEEGRFLQATTNSSQVAQKVAESLPNIRGQFSATVNNRYYQSSAFSRINLGDNSQGVVGGYPSGLDFNASLSSPVYKDGAKVQPNNIKCYMWQRIA